MGEKTILTSSYKSQLHRQEPDLLVVQRQHFWPENSQQLDAFGSYWLLIDCNFPEGLVTVQGQGKRHAIEGPMWIFIPPHSLVDWHFLHSHVTWTGYVSSRTLPDSAPKEACTLAKENERSFQSVAEIYAFLSSWQDATSIEKKETDHILALATKSFIDENYKNNFKLYQIADKHNTSSSVIIREFKKCFGLSPLAYRNKMRIMDASCEISFQDEKSIGRISHELGFNDSGQFRKAFKEDFRTSPKSFKF